MEGITDVDYRHAKKLFKEFKMNNLGDYHDLYVQSNTLLLADVFENFRNKCIEIYKLDPAHTRYGIKKTGIILELMTDINMLFMIERGIRVGICHATHRSKQ